MVQRENVHAVKSDHYSDYYLAWVCTMCSAVFPIAVKTKFLGGATPLYEDGRSND